MIFAMLIIFNVRNMTKNIENSILDTQIEFLCELYEKNKFLTVIQKTKSLLENFKFSITLYNILGMAYVKINKFDNAIESYQGALKLNPGYHVTLYNLGIVYHEKMDFEKAIFYYKKAIKHYPDYLDALFNLGFVYKQKGQFLKAAKLFKTIISKEPKYFNAFRCLSEIFCEYGDLYSGSKNLRIVIEALQLNPNDLEAFDTLLFYINYTPFLNIDEIYDFYYQFDLKYGVPLQKYWKPFPQIKKNKPKLKIGYVSPDFKKHSAENFLKPVLKNHNHEKFEIYAFAELSQEDSTTLQYKSYVDHWIPTQGLTDWEIAQKIRELEIDILVDVAGHTKGNRLGVFAYKPAPISLSWLGFGYTTGLSAIDYFLTDNVVVPQGSEHLFSEKIWRINDYCYCCYEEKAKMGKVGPLPALAKGYVTFGTLTRSIRINDRVIKVWAEILKRVKNSKLVINSKVYGNILASKLLIKKFQLENISSNRLEIGYQSPPWDLMRQIDIALDCFPHNSGTTLIEHLFMGNPFITFSNRPGVGKIGSSILSTLGHSEWVATSEDEYIQKAVNLASDFKKLNTIRGSLRKEMEQSPIMDRKGFVFELESIYQNMWENYLNRK